MNRPTRIFQLTTLALLMSAGLAQAQSASYEYRRATPGLGVSTSSGQTTTPTNPTPSQPPAAPAALTLSTQALAFGDVLVGTNPSPKKQLQLSNTGGTALSITAAPTLTGAAAFTASSNCGSSLAAGASCQVEVTFAPAVAGSASASLDFSTNLAGSPHKVDVTGTGTQASGALAATTSADFGSVNINSAASRTFTYTNTGNAPATNVIATVQGTSLSMTANTCGTLASPGTLAGGASCSVTVSYAPTASGTLSNAKLTVASSAVNSPSEQALTGTAIDPLADPHWNNVVLLSHGADFTDAKGNLTFSVMGNTSYPAPSVATPTGAPYGSALYFPDGQRYLQSAQSVPFGTGDWTIEFWAMRTGAATWAASPNSAVSSGTKTTSTGTAWRIASVHTNYTDPGWNLVMQEECTGMAVNCGSYGTTLTLTGTTAQKQATDALNVWNHIAFTRQGLSLRMYVNGTLVGTKTMNANYSMDNTASSTSWPIQIGYGFVGYIDELRLTKGVARYTGTSFPLQTAPFANYGN